MFTKEPVRITPRKQWAGVNNLRNSTVQILNWEEMSVTTVFIGNNLPRVNKQLNPAGDILKVCLYP